MRLIPAPAGGPGGAPQHGEADGYGHGDQPGGDQHPLLVSRRGRNHLHAARQRRRARALREGEGDVLGRLEAVPGSFSRQRRTIRSRAAEMFRPAAESSAGFSFRIAAMVSAGVSLLNAFRPESSSYRIAPNAKMSERWSTLSPRTCSGDM